MTMHKIICKLTSNRLGRVTAIKIHGLCCVAMRLLLCGESRLRGALLLWLVIAWEPAMRQHAIQRHRQGGACAARWKEACEATGMSGSLESMVNCKPNSACSSQRPA